MKIENGFWKHLRNYFSVYLPKQRNSGDNTIIASRQTWNMMLRFLCNIKAIPLDSVEMGTIDAKLLTEFLDTMEYEKGWKVSTRNNRLSLIRSFYTYATCMEPANYIYECALKAVPLKKDVNKSFTLEYMEEDAVKALLAAPNVTKRLGIRDQFFLSLMYDSAARDCEMLTMKASDFNDDSATVYLIGKGAKPRLVPVSKETVSYHKYYQERFHDKENLSAPMFYTIHRGKKTSMSDDNVARFIKKYADIARKSCDKIPKNVHPHLLRKSRAMHLYQAGMPLSVLSEFLGHEDPETTLIYARADTEMKRKAIEKAGKESGMINVSETKALWEGNDDIIEKLCRGYS
ncbi:MAG: tyrosine-type recombinase/integrase [Butyrivibrio sp.]|nr:tyrosine-type recombinase/integrase [Butyrivibrio sp.]MBR1641080.1 tyrosine-type recombinase/integrase [Butyrivibrio sp.]